MFPIDVLFDNTGGETGEIPLTRSSAPAASATTETGSTASTEEQSPSIEKVAEKEVDAVDSVVSVFESASVTAATTCTALETETSVTESKQPDSSPTEDKIAAVTATAASTPVALSSFFKHVPQL
eukprot:gene35311-43535_t